MIYDIDGKYYIKVQGYYKEVELRLIGGNFDIKPKNNKIEVTVVKNANVVNINSKAFKRDFRLKRSPRLNEYENEEM